MTLECVCVEGIQGWLKFGIKKGTDVCNFETHPKRKTKKQKTTGEQINGQM